MTQNTGPTARDTTILAASSIAAGLLAHHHQLDDKAIEKIAEDAIKIAKKIDALLKK